MNDTVVNIILVSTMIISVICLIMILSLKKKDYTQDLNDMKTKIAIVEDDMKDIRNDLLEEQNRTKREIIHESRESLNVFSQMITSNQKTALESQVQNFIQFENRLQGLEKNNELKLEAMRTTIEKRLTYIQEDNNKKLDEVRKTVDEKLQQTLEDRINKSFATVTESLERVYKGIGEMQQLATGVGDLKKVLSNVKSRGILGEIQLGAILEDILTSDQYDTNVATIPNSKNRVEYAVKLPGTDDRAVYLPIDSKFPSDAYVALQDAYETGNQEMVNSAAATLFTRLKSFAKDIHDKYIEPPYTTDFAILFLPFEGLYAEVVNRGYSEQIARDYRITVVGPSNMAALLNSLQMGFKTLAIEKRSSEVWEILGAVKTEFEKFQTTLENAQNRINQVNNDLDQLVGTRTRAINRKLRTVQKIELKTNEILELEND